MCVYRTDDLTPVLSNRDRSVRVRVGHSDAPPRRIFPKVSAAYAGRNCFYVVVCQGEVGVSTVNSEKPVVLLIQAPVCSDRCVRA